MYLLNVCRKTYSTLYLFLVFFSLSFVPLSFASEMDTDDLFDLSLRDLMSIQVFEAATLIPTEQTKAPGTVYSFNRDDFKRFGVRTLEELIRFVPGFQLNQYRKRHNSLWSRGTLDRYNDKMVLMIDGIPIHHLYYNDFSVGEDLPLENIEKVEIIIGPASSLYGANAFGGLISVTTREFTSSSQIETTAGIADNHRAKGTINYSSKSLQIFTSYMQQDAPYPIDRKSFIGGSTVQPLNENYGNLHIKAMATDDLVLSLDYSSMKMPFIFIPNTQDAWIEKRPLTLSARYTNGDIDTGKVEAKIYYTREEIKEYEIENIARTTAMTEFQNGVMAGASITGFKSYGRHTYTLGATWDRDEAGRMDNIRYWSFSSGYVNPPVTTPLLSNPNVVNDNYAVFMQYVLEYNEDLNITLGGRFDKYDAFGDRFNYRAALVWSIDENQTAKLLYGTATRTPNYREYLKVMQGTTFVPPVPKPEQMHSLEVGYTYQWENASVSTTVFRNTFTDYLRETQTPDNADEYFANSNETWTMDGLEALIMYNPTPDIRTHFTAAYLDATRSNQGKLPYLASWTGSFNLDYRYFEKHNLGFSILFNSGRTDTNNYPNDTPGSFVLANIHLSGDISESLGYRFGVYNVADRKIFDPAGDFGTRYNTMEPIKQIWLELQYTFK